MRRVLSALALGVALIAQTAGAEIKSARYSEPTTRYTHGVLGDAIEYGALELRLSNGTARILRLPDTRVFEDLQPRLMDLDGDDVLEIITIESHRDRGARLAIYDQNGLISATPYIGRRHRWLAPLGGADLDGDGAIELAYIDRPHLAKILRVWRYTDRELRHVADLPGLSNHRIGENFISGGIRHCGAAPEIITADADWRRIIATTFDGTQFHSRQIAPFSGISSLREALQCS